MGMDDVAIPYRDGGMQLRGGGAQKQNVSRAAGTGCRDEPGGMQRFVRDREVPAAGAVVGGQIDPDPDHSEACEDQPDTVEPMRPVAALQPEGRADEIARCTGERFCTVHQLRDG